MTWTTPATRCGESSHCLQFRTSADGVEIRNSADPDTVLTATAAEWHAFVTGVKTGDFDNIGEHS